MVVRKGWSSRWTEGLDLVGRCHVGPERLHCRCLDLEFVGRACVGRAFRIAFRKILNSFWCWAFRVECWAMLGLFGVPRDVRPSLRGVGGV